MADNIYPIGYVVRCRGTVTASGTAVDPGTVVAKWRIDPAGSITTYTYDVDVELVKASTGVYYFDIDASSEGRYLYRFVGTGANQTAKEASFLVSGSEFD